MKYKKMQKAGVLVLALQILLFTSFFLLRDSITAQQNLDTWHAYIFKMELGYLANEVLSIMLGVGIWLVCQYNRHQYHRILMGTSVGVHIVLLLINVFRWFVYDWFAIAWLAILAIITTWIYGAKSKTSHERIYS